MKRPVTFHIPVFNKKWLLILSALFVFLSAHTVFAAKSINPAAPAAYTGPNQSICNGTTVSLGGAAVAGSTYSWSPGTGLSSSTVSNPNASPNATITYTLTETNGGVSNSNTVTITVNPVPDDNTGPDQVICLGSGVSIGAAPSPGSSYSWSPSAGLSSSTVSNPTASPAVSTTYTLVETYTATGCSSNNTVQIVVNPLPAANAGSNQTICAGSSATIGSAPVTGNTYTWSPSTGLNSPSSSQPVASPTVTTTYTLTETITATDCQKTNTVVVTVNPAPAANTGPNQTICSGTGAGGGVTIGAAPAAGDTYTWSPATGLSSTTVSNPTASPAVTTTYTLTETNTSTGCTKTGTVTVNVNPAPAANTGPNQTICNGSGVVIGSAPVSGDTYSWTPATGLSSTTVSNPTASPVATTTYTLTETITATGCSRMNVVTVTVNPSPAANTGPNKGICLGGSTTIGAPPVAGDTYSWSPLLGLSSTTSSQPTASPLVTTTYTLTETITATGCTQTGTVTVTVSAPPTPIAGPNQTICEGESATLGTAVSIPGHTYTWTPTTGLSTPNASQTLASPSVTTTYTLTESSAAGCSKSDSVKVTVNPAPAANAGTNQTICDGSTTTIGAPPVSGHTYSWSPATGLSSTTSSQPTAAPTTTTTYT
ncbi:MAG TPA: hypothetical protein VGO45_03585, partial [Bacteroidia bacterium]|nr:hypothetical protein [Bacteroidia bacterium]